MKKFVSVFLVLMLVFSVFAGCKAKLTPAQKIEKAMEASEKEESMKGDLEIVMSMVMKSGDTEMPLDMNVSGTVESVKSPKAIRVVMHTSFFGEENEHESIVLEEDGGLYSYEKSSDDEEYQRSETDKLTQFDIPKMKDAIKDLPWEEAKDGDKTVLTRVLDANDSKKITSMLKDTDLGDVGGLVSEVAGVEEDGMPEDALVGCVLKVILDKDDKLNEISIDLAEMMKKASEEAAQEATEEDAMFSMEVSAMSLSIKNIAFGGVEIKAPEKWVEAEEFDADEFDIDEFDLMDDEEETDPEEDTEPTDESEDQDEAETEEVTEPSDETEDVIENTLDATGTWEDGVIVIDEVPYHLLDNIKLFYDTGWSFDLTDYGKDSYILNPGDKVSSTIDLISDKYGDDYRAPKIRVGFTNTGDKAKDITECEVWSIGVDCTFGAKLLDSSYDFYLPCGLKKGMTEEEVIAIVGPCDEDDIYESTLGYKSFDYESEEHRGLQMELTIYDDGGLQAITLKQY